MFNNDKVPYLNGVKETLYDCWVNIKNLSNGSINHWQLIDIDVGSLFKKGEALLWQSEYQKSIEWFDKALKINPKHFNSLYAKGKILTSIGKQEEALIFLSQALQLAPNNGWIVLYMDICKQELKK